MWPHRYRGPRAGFAYRNGPWGKGYYAKGLMSSGSVHTVPPHEEYPPNSAQEDERAAPKAPSHDAMCGSDGPQKEERTDMSPLPETKSLQGASLVPKDVQERRSLIKQMMAKSTARIRCSVMTSDRKLLVTGDTQAALSAVLSIMQQPPLTPLCYADSLEYSSIIAAEYNQQVYVHYG